MSEPRSLDLSRLTTGDWILLGAGAALFVDSLLTWQRTCVTVAGVDVCERANAWGGDGALAGALMALLALGACLVVLATAGEVSLAPLGVPAGAAVAGLGVATGLIKLLLIAGRFPSYGAWIGLVLLAALAAGGLIKMAEQREVRPPG